MGRFVYQPSLATTLYRPASIAALLCALLLAPLAGAQERVPPDSEVAPRELPPLITAARPEDESFAGGHVAGGAVWLSEPRMGAYARVAGDLYTKTGRWPATVFGMWHGLESFFIEDGFGFAAPVVGYGGVQLGAVYGTLGAGVNLAHVDELDENFGFGVLSPRANGRLGVEIGVVHVVATWDLQWRWSWGRSDLTVFQTGLVLGFAGEIPPK